MVKRIMNTFRAVKFARLAYCIVLACGGNALHFASRKVGGMRLKANRLIGDTRCAEYAFMPCLSKVPSPRDEVALNIGFG